MNRFSSHPNHENHTIYEGSRLRASPRHGGQRVFLNFFRHRSDRGGAPSGAAAIIVTDGEKGNNPRVISE